MSDQVYSCLEAGLGRTFCTTEDQQPHRALTINDLKAAYGAVADAAESAYTWLTTPSAPDNDLSSSSTANSASRFAGGHAPFQP